LGTFVPFTYKLSARATEENQFDFATFQFGTCAQFWGPSGDLSRRAHHQEVSQRGPTKIGNTLFLGLHINCALGHISEEPTPIFQPNTGTTTGPATVFLQQNTFYLDLPAGPTHKSKVHSGKKVTSPVVTEIPFITPPGELSEN